LPFEDPEQLAFLAARSEAGYDISVSIPNFHSWEAENRLFESMGASRGTTLNLTGGDQPERLEGQMVLGDFFGVLGRTPILGRALEGDQTRRGAERLAVVSHGLWQRRFGADPDFVGQTVLLDGQPFTVTGVMPEDFIYPTPTTDVWVPMGVYADTLPWDNRGNSPGIYAVARMSPGVTLDAARADMESVGKRVQEETGWPGMPTVTSLRDRALGSIEPVLLVLFGAVAFVLLIACANVANLLLARGEDREREIAVRTALGAGRGRIIRQLLTESVALSVVAGALGTLLAYWGIAALVASLPSAVPLVDRVGLDPRVLGFTLALSILTGVVFGLVPALQSSRFDLHDSLKEGGRGSNLGTRRGWLRNALVVSEVAIALVLLVSAGLLIQSFSRLRAVEPGFRAESVVNMRISLPTSEYSDTTQWYEFYERFLERVETLPGVVSAAVNNGVPLASGGTESGALPDSRPLSENSMESCLYQAVSPDYFETLGIPLLRGRAFSGQDREERPLVAVVDETMAREFWPGEDPVGRRVAFEYQGSGDAPEPIWREVVGVVGHVRHYELKSESRVQIYVPYTQPPIWFESRRRPMAVFVKTRIEPASIVPVVRSELRALDPNLPMYDIQTMEEVVSQEVGTDRMFSGVLSIFAAVAMLLAAVGIYGVLSYTVSRRTHEIGVRLALGAGTGDVIRLILRRSLLLTAAGLGIGLAAAFAATRVLAGALFEVSATDPVTYGGVGLLLAFVALMASYIPARRATRVDPVIALRYE
jgi:putative ABC transport system permease protein